MVQPYPRFRAILAFALFFPGNALAGQGLTSEQETKLAGVIEIGMEEGHIPSLAIALVKGETVVWSRAFGYSNVWAKTPATTDTIYLIGSTYKAMSTFALLQQMEEGKLELDDRVSSVSGPLRIEGETEPITIRHLLTHTSGLATGFGAHPVWGNTVPGPIEEYLRRTLRVERAPRDSYEYSNVAYTLIAYIIERVSGEDYKQYMRKHIFEPLEMNDTEFAPRLDMIERMAIPYEYQEKNDIQVPTTRLKADAWPAGIVYGTVLNQANWLIANLNRGKFNGKRIIRKKTFREMMRPQYDEPAGIASGNWHTETARMGLTWWVVDTEDGKLFAHSGSVPGYTAWITGNLDAKTGVAILTNGHRSHPHLSKIASEGLRILAEAAEK